MVSDGIASFSSVSIFEPCFEKANLEGNGRRKSKRKLADSERREKRHSESDSDSDWSRKKLVPGILRKTTTKRKGPGSSYWRLSNTVNTEKFLFSKGNLEFVLSFFLSLFLFFLENNFLKNCFWKFICGKKERKNKEMKKWRNEERNGEREIKRSGIGKEEEEEGRKAWFLQSPFLNSNDPKDEFKRTQFFPTFSKRQTEPVLYVIIHPIVFKLLLHC